MAFLRRRLFGLLRFRCTCLGGWIAELRASATSGQGSHYSDANSDGGWSDISSISSPVKGGLNTPGTAQHSTAAEPAEPRSTSADGASAPAAQQSLEARTGQHAMHEQPQSERGAVTPEEEAAAEQQSEPAADMHPQQHEVHIQQQRQQQQHRSASGHLQATDLSHQQDAVPVDHPRGTRGRSGSQAEATVAPPSDGGAFTAADETAARQRCGEVAVGSAGFSEARLKLLLYPDRLRNIPLVQVAHPTGMLSCCMPSNRFVINTH